MLEAVLELAWDELEGAHAAGTGGLAALGLLTPVVLNMLVCEMSHVSNGALTLSDAGAWVSAVGASVLLNVHGATTATSAEDVRLVVSLTEAGGTLRCGNRLAMASMP